MMNSNVTELTKL